MSGIFLEEKAISHGSLVPACRACGLSLGQLAGETSRYKCHTVRAWQGPIACRGQVGQRASREDSCGLKAAGTRGREDFYTEEMVPPRAEVRAKSPAWPSSGETAEKCTGAALQLRPE